MHPAVHRSAHGRGRRHPRHGLPPPLRAVDVRLVRLGRYRHRNLVLFAALGALGQLVALLLFVYLALASSGGTIPLQALGAFYRLVANFEPLRQILDAVRSILYFDGNGAAGLERGLVLTSVGLVLWLIVGAGVTTWYDRHGLDRMSPELMEYVHTSAQAYRADV